jgi:hypothetical protein
LRRREFHSRAATMARITVVAAPRVSAERRRNRHEQEKHRQSGEVRERQASANGPVEQRISGKILIGL